MCLKGKKCRRNVRYATMTGDILSGLNCRLMRDNRFRFRKGAGTGGDAFWGSDVFPECILSGFCRTAFQIRFGRKTREEPETRKIRKVWKTKTGELMEKEIKENILKISKALNKEGLRVIAVAQKKNIEDIKEFGVQDEKNMTLIGFIGFLDPPKESAKD